MFSEDPCEQELYHAIATVASLLLRIGEVGKRFSNNNGAKKPDAGPAPAPPPPAGPSEPAVPEREPPEGSPGQAQVCRALAEAQLEAPLPPASDEDVKDDTSVSSYSMVSAGSLQCDDIADDTVLVGRGDQRRASQPDADWSITFEQVLASLLTEPALVDYFERKRDVGARMASCKSQRAVERQVSSASEHELALLSG